MYFDEGVAHISRANKGHHILQIISSRPITPESVTTKGVGRDLTGNRHATQITHSAGPSQHGPNDGSSPYETTTPSVVFRQTALFRGDILSILS